MKQILKCYCYRCGRITPHVRNTNTDNLICRSCGLIETPINEPIFSRRIWLIPIIMVVTILLMLFLLYK